MDSENDNKTSIAAGMNFEVGQIVFEKFEVQATLGSGNMGQVYRVRDINLDKSLALKVLIEHSRDESALVRFQNEAKSNSRLNHPVIATVYDFGFSQDGSPYLATEFIDGVTLQAVLKDKVRLTVEEVIVIFIQICDGLECAHRNGIVHRDIKPGNIMISQAEDGATIVKFVDFGIARIVPCMRNGSAAGPDASTGSHWTSVRLPVQDCLELKAESAAVRAELQEMKKRSSQH